MRVIPALDLRDGKTVRLRQGNYEDQINYEVEPHAVSEAFVEAGAELIHVVDLDSARDGRRRHATLIAELAAIPGANIELGGGIRSQE
ncbi:MAG: HisA/HisF-related TIM barrel protein, partial [Acidimicrobiia bacterium]